MSSSTATPEPVDDNTAVLELTVAQRNLILLMIVLGSTMFFSTIMIASTLLPQIQGTMSATQDEIAWTMTFNILATAVATPMTGWLVTRFGRRNVMVCSVAGFTFSTMMCGLAGSLEALVVWRIGQGALGAPMVPLGQAILFDSFPRRQHAFILSLFGMATVVGPALGPAFGGWLAETYNWRYAFYMFLPMGIVSFIGLMIVLPKDAPEEKVGLDWVGFLTLSAAIGATQMVLSRGQRLDWFESSEIVAYALIAVAALYLFVVHSLTAERPFLSPALLKDRNLAIGLLLVIIYGMVNFTPMVILPSLLQNHVGFPDSLIGEVVGMRGVGGLLGFFMSGFLAKVDPRYGLLFGFGLLVGTGVWLMTLDLNVSAGVLYMNSFLQGVASAVIWVPLMVATFSTLDSRLRPEAMAMFHLLRNIGASFFISLSVAEIVRATGANYSRLTEQINPFNRALATPTALGAWDLDTPPGLARIAGEITRQAAMIGYLNAFVIYAAASFAAMLLAMLVRRRAAG